MPFDGSGNFNRVRNWVNDALANIKIKSDFHDSEDDNLASGLSNCITKDGQTQPTANIPLNGHKLINLATPTNPTDAVTKAYADAVRNFTTGVTLSGTSTGTSPNFVSTAWIGFTEADLSIVARKADPAAVPPTVDRLMLNSTANGTGPDIGALDTQTAQARNRIVNPAMQVSQENGNTAATTSAYYAADQWALFASSTAVIQSQRVISGTPNGSVFRFRATINTADAALAAGDFATIRQTIEGIRLADTKWGVAAARQAIVRFGFKAPAGTYSFRLMNAALTRSYVQNFTITAGQANTDTEQVFVVPGETTGVWPTDTSLAMFFDVVIAAGSTFQSVVGWSNGSFMGTAANSNGMATVGNTFELFDVGLYLDPQNTGLPPPWQMPDEAQEVALCMRYFEILAGNGFGWSGNATSGGGYVARSVWVVPKRVSPTASGASSTSNGFPATVGTLFPAYASIGETRTCNATTTAGQWATTVTANARM